MTETLEIFDASNNDWEEYDPLIAQSTTDWPFINSGTFDDSTRVLAILTDDRDTYNAPTTINMRWKVTDALSTVASGAGTLY